MGMVVKENALAVYWKQGILKMKIEGILINVISTWVECVLEEKEEFWSEVERKYKSFQGGRGCYQSRRQ